MDFSKRVESLGLSSEIVSLHKERIKQFISSNFTSLPKYSIAETCKTEDQTVLSYDIVKNYGSSVEVESLVLAAGASSRYLKPLYVLASELKGTKIDLGSQQIKDILNSALPEELKETMQTEGFIFDDAFKALIDKSAKPKAMQPCFKGGLNFLQTKLKENKSYGFKRSHIIIPFGSEAEFKDLNLGSDTHFYEQNEPYSTLRFNENGDPLEVDQKLSLVPAGHGGITQFIHVVKEKCPTAQGVLFRNIDNLTGDKPEVVEGVKNFNRFFGFVLSAIKNIRQSLKDGELSKAEVYAKEIYLKIFENQSSTNSKDTPYLYALMENLFATNTSKEKLLDDYQRPVNILGQVQNLGSDVGGLPCIAYDDKKKFKFCLEMSHAKDEFQETFFDPTKATHFNPVWILAEVPDNEINYQKIAQDFWIIAKKSYLGKTVYYHETLLSEVLGNSLYFNLAFAEIPRAMFNPCKMITDTQSGFDDYFV